MVRTLSKDVSAARALRVAGTALAPVIMLCSVVTAGPAADREAPPGGHVSLIAVPETGSSRLFRLTCRNGLPVSIDSRPGSRTVFIQIGVRVGSRDEPLRLAGMSHLLEHLLFKEGHGEGTRRNPAFSALRGAGGVINASTEFEQTEYHADLPAERFEEGWHALVSLVTETAFGDEDVARERGVVLQEVAMGKTDPLSIMAYSVLRRVFPGDPIGQPIIGFRRTLSSITTADARDHYRRFYVPANMFAVIVGDVDPEQAAALVESTLGTLGGTDFSHPAYPAPAARTESLYRFRTLVKQSYLLAGALTGGEIAPDSMALDLLSTVLGGGRSSRLQQRLVERQALTDQVIALNFSVSNAGAFGAGCAVDTHRSEETRGILLDEIGRLAREPVSEEELATALRLLHGRLSLLFETNEGVAAFRAQRMLRRQPLSRDDYLAQADRLTSDDLLAAARAHWGAAPPVEIQVLPARGPGKILAALKFLIFRRL